MPPTPPIRVVIADDQGLVRFGLRKIIDQESDLEVVGEAVDGAAVVDLALRVRPHVALMDIRMPGMDGIEAARRVVATNPATRVLMLTTFGFDSYVYESLRAGASGFMLKDSPPEEIVGAVRIVASGEAMLAPAVTRQVIDEFARLPRPPRRVETPAALTAREREVFALLVRGLSNAQICDALTISDATVKTHVARVLQKLGLRDRVQVVIHAYESGLITPGQAP
jgi:DNA-binding NarL/FixJ family response regulator